jgi:MinD superfamily P-loop ATPase
MDRRVFFKRSLGFIALGGISLSALANASNDKVKKYMVITGRCEGCGRCLKSCHEHALSADKNGKAVIDPKKCKGCGDCTRYCKNMAIVEKYR